MRLSDTARRPMSPSEPTCTGWSKRPAATRCVASTMSRMGRVSAWMMR